MFLRSFSSYSAMQSLTRVTKLLASRSSASCRFAASSVEALPPRCYCMLTCLCHCDAAAEAREAAEAAQPRRLTGEARDAAAWARRAAAHRFGVPAAAVSVKEDSTRSSWGLLHLRRQRIVWRKKYATARCCIPSAVFITPLPYLVPAAAAAPTAAADSGTSPNTSAASYPLGPLTHFSAFFHSLPSPVPATTDGGSFKGGVARSTTSGIPFSTATRFYSEKDNTLNMVHIAAPSAGLWPSECVPVGAAVVVALVPRVTTSAATASLHPHATAVAAATDVTSFCIREAKCPCTLLADAVDVWDAAAAGMWDSPAAVRQELQHARGTTPFSLSPTPASSLGNNLARYAAMWKRRSYEASENIWLCYGVTIATAAATATLQPVVPLKARNTAAVSAFPREERHFDGDGDSAAEGLLLPVAATASTRGSQQKRLLQHGRNNTAFCRQQAVVANTGQLLEQQQLERGGRRARLFSTKTGASQTDERQHKKAKIVLTPKLVLRRSPFATTRFPTTLKEGAYAVLPAQPIPMHIQRPPYAYTAGGVYPPASSSNTNRSTTAVTTDRVGAMIRGDQTGGYGVAAATGVDGSNPGRAASASAGAAFDAAADLSELAAACVSSGIEATAAADEEDDDVFAPVQPPAAQEKLRRAARVAANALQLCTRAAQEGVTTEDLDRIAHEYIVGVGAYPAAVNFHNFPKAICASVNEVACHGIPDLRPLQSGDLLTIDCTSYLDGYFGDCAATVMIGEVLPEHRRLVEASKEALEKAIDIVKPGLPISEIGRRTSQVARARGFSVVKEFSGHFIGNKLHLPPLISHTYPNTTEGVFRVGQTLTIEPILCEGSPDVFSWQDGWSIATQDGGRSAQFEHTLLVTEDGAEILTLPTI